MTKPLRLNLLAASVAFTGALIPWSVQAQGVTAQELWEAWQDGVAVAGGTLSATESREGNQLVLSDLRLDLGGEGGVLQLERMKLTNQADGSVGVILPERFPLLFELPRQAPVPENGADSQSDRPEKAFITVEAPALNLIVRGLGDRAEFQATAPEVRLVLDRFVPPIPAEDGLVAISAVLSDFDLRYLQDLALDAPMLDGALSFSSLTAELSVTGGETGDGRTEIRIGKSDAAISGAVPVASPEFAALRNGAQSDQPDPGAIVALLGAGLRASGAVNLGKVSFTGDVDIAGNAPARWDLGFDELALSIGVDAAKAGYNTAVKGLRFFVEGEIPDFPGSSMEFTLAEYRMALSAGLNGLRGPQDWAAAYVLRDLTLSDSLWESLSLQAEIPRDPMTLAIDLGGKYAISPEVLEPGWTASPERLPFSEFSFAINEFDIGGMGLKVVGQGGLGFDFGDLTSFDGLPAPAGRVGFLTTGAYGLLDLLVKSGQVPASEVAGIRTGLLMIGRAGEAPDTLHTDLDFRDKGFFLNGMKIR